MATVTSPGPVDRDRRRSRLPRHAARLLAGLGALVPIVAVSLAPPASTSGPVPTYAGATVAAADDQGASDDQGFTFTGTKKTGSTSSAETPNLTPGTYRTALPLSKDLSDDTGAETPDGARYFTVEKGRGQGVWVTAVTRLPDGSTGTGRFDISLDTLSGDSCAGDESSHEANAVSLLFGASAHVKTMSERTTDTFDDPATCANPEKLLLRVAFGYSPPEDDDTDDDSASRPPEKPLKRSPTIELVVLTEPPTTNVKQLPEAAEAVDDFSYEPSWSPGAENGDVDGATSFADAPTLKEGSQSDTVAAGDLHVYRFKVDYGQAAEVIARFPIPAPKNAPPDDGLGVSVSTVAPTLAPIQSYAGDIDGSSDLVVGNKLPEIRYRNRYENISTDWLPRTSLAGYYYVVVGAEPAAKSVRVPVQLDLKITGKPSGEPKYEGIKPVSDSQADEQKASTGAGFPSWLTTSVGSVAIVVLLGAAILLFVRARRR